MAQILSGIPGPVPSLVNALLGGPENAQKHGGGGGGGGGGSGHHAPAPAPANAQQQHNNNPKPAPKPQPKSNPKPAPKPAPNPAPKPAPKAQPKPQPKAQPNPQPKPQPKPAPQPQPVAVSHPPTQAANVKTVVVYHTLQPTFSGKPVGYHTLRDATVGHPIHSSQQYVPPPSSSVPILEPTSSHQSFHLKPSSAAHSYHSHHPVVHHAIRPQSTTLKHAAFSSAGLKIAHSTPHFASPTDLSASSPSKTPTSSSSSSSSGLSTGAKIGIALAVILGLALLAGLIFFLYRRRKNENDGHERLDDEKAAIVPPTPYGPPRVNIRSHDAATGPPRLSMRPLTDLFPASPSEKPQTSALNGFLAPGAAAVNARSASPVGQPGQNSYEMSARDPVNDPANPFGSHAETVNGGAQRSLVAGAAAASLSPKPLSIKSVNSGRNSPEAQRTSPPSRSASPALAGAAFAGAGPRSGPPGARGPPPGPNNVHRVQLDFKPSMEDELELRAGQVVKMLHEYDDGWALCIRLDRSQQGVVPRTCISKHPVRPRPPPGMRGPQQGPPRSMSPADGMTSGRSSPAFDGQRRPPMGPPAGGRARSYSNTMRPGGPPRAQSPGPRPDGSYAGRPDSRRRSNSAGGPYQSRRRSPPEGGPMNPSAFNPQSGRPPMRKPVAGQAI